MQLLVLDPSLYDYVFAKHLKSHLFSLGMSIVGHAPIKYAGP